MRSNRPEDFQDLLDSMREGLRLMEPLREHHTGVGMLEAAIKVAQDQLDARPFDSTIVLAACYPAKLIWDRLMDDYNAIRRRLSN